MLSSKKVLFTSHTANFSKFNRPFMRWFKENGYEVHYASAGEENVLDCDKHFNIPFERHPFKFNNIKSIVQLRKIINSENYDIIHTHTPMGSVVTRIAAIKARKHGTRVIYTAHGFHFYKGAPLLNWLVYYPIEKTMSRFTDTIITINKEDYRCATKHFKVDVEYIPGVGVELNNFIKVDLVTKLKLRKKYGYNDDDFILVFAAELNNNKNQELLINSMMAITKLIPNAKLLLCGTGKNEILYSNLIKKLNLSKHIQLLGYRKNIDNFFQLSDICVSSSIREGLGLNIIEAMSVGLPVIASDNRGHRSIINNEENGYLFRKKKDFIEIVYRLYGNDVLLKEISNRGKKSIDIFSVERALIDMASIYGKSC